MADIAKFHFAELFNNSKGKTSASILSGLIIVLTGCVCFFIGAYNKHNDTIVGSGGIITIGAGLLGIRRFTQDKPLTANEQAQQTSVHSTDTASSFTDIGQM